MAFKASHILALAALFGLCACDGGTASIPGHYEGFLISTGQLSISAEVQMQAGQGVQVQIKPEPSGDELDFKMTYKSDSEIVLAPANTAASSLFADGKPLDLKKPDGGDCFVSGGNDFCIGGGGAPEISMQFGQSSSQPAERFVLDKTQPNANQPSAPVTMETPKEYSVDDLVERAKDRSYNSEIEFESVMQARLNAKVSYANLAPHFNINTAFDLIGLVPTSMIHAIGDLIPFFLPNRWFQAKEAADQADAEFDSYRVIQKSAMNVVQGLAYSVLRDEQALRCMQESRAEVTEIRDQLLALEQQGGGGTQVGSSDAVTSALLALVSGIDTMKEVIHEEKMELSQASGFVNTAAVDEVTPVTTPTINGPLAGTQTDLESDASNRALELKQIADLTAAAKEGKKASFFQWLDPTASDEASLGLGTVDYIKIGSSEIRQLYDKWGNAHSQVLLNVDTALSQSKNIADLYAIAAQGSKTAQDQIDKYRLDLDHGIAFQMSLLITALQDKVSNDVGQINALFSYMTLQAQMDSLTYSGVYAPLLTEKSP